MAPCAARSVARGIEDGAAAPQAPIERGGRDRPGGAGGLLPARQRVEVTLHVAPRGTGRQQRRESLVERERPPLAPGPGAGVGGRAERGGVPRVERRIVLRRPHEQERALDRGDARLGGAGEEARLGARELRPDHPREPVAALRGRRAFTQQLRGPRGEGVGGDGHRDHRTQRQGRRRRAWPLALPGSASAEDHGERGERGSGVESHRRAAYTPAPAAHGRTLAPGAGPPW